MSFTVDGRTIPRFDTQAMHDMWWNSVSSPQGRLVYVRNPLEWPSPAVRAIEAGYCAEFKPWGGLYFDPQSSSSSGEDEEPCQGIVVFGGDTGEYRVAFYDESVSVRFPDGTSKKRWIDEDEFTEGEAIWYGTSIHSNNMSRGGWINMADSPFRAAINEMIDEKAAEEHAVRAEQRALQVLRHGRAPEDQDVAATPEDHDVAAAQAMVVALQEAVTQAETEAERLRARLDEAERALAVAQQKSRAATSDPAEGGPAARDPELGEKRKRNDDDEGRAASGFCDM